MKKVFIVGSEGTTGLRLKSRLALRPDVELITIEEKLRKDTAEILRLMEASDFAFLCLPDDAALEIAGLAGDMDVKIIDTSTAHRTHPNWDYGFPELSPEYRKALGFSKRAACPGCHASGYIALLRPLAEAGIIPPDLSLSCTSLTGYSGGGKKMIARYEDASRGDEYKSAYLYAMGQQHKHLPEMAAHSGIEAAPIFMPVVGDFYSGMIVTAALSEGALSRKADIQALRDIYRRHYAGSAVVRVSENEPAALYANAMSGRDDMEIFVTGTGGRILLTAMFDNLGKGASGAAIQCFNIMSGVHETTGLAIGESSAPSAV